jgi:SAM-dependent methyltransferase
MKLMQTVGSDLSHFSCPACGCTDRDRHLWLYLEAIGLPPCLPGADVLHLAPEAALERLIAAQKPGSYVRGDLYPYRPGHLVIDAQSLQFDDASFDLVVCNHVLEHVSCPELALQECRRVLRRGGMLIAQTPYSPTLRHTFERLDAVDPGFATLFYGQADHVRLFGADIGGYFRRAGFIGELLSHDQLLAGIDPALAGCNVREPLFAFYNA